MLKIELMLGTMVLSIIFKFDENCITLSKNVKMDTMTDFMISCSDTYILKKYNLLTMCAKIP